jgi:GTPase SAR1 family protein
MRLMLLGDEQTGKTSLIQALKREYAQMNQSQQQQRKVRISERLAS